MNINIHGHHLDTGATLREHVETRLPEMIEKYFARASSANVGFAKQGAGFETHCAVHLDSGIYLHASANAGDIYQSFDQSLARLEKQLRRYKRRLTNHHAKGAGGETSAEAAEKIFAPEGGSDAEEAGETFTPVIIAEDTKRIPELTISEAVMQLELGHDDFVLFQTTTKDATKRHLIYRRHDKNIGWMDL